MLPIQILVADNTSGARQSLLWLFESDPDIEVVGQVSRLSDVVPETKRKRPTILLIDLNWNKDRNQLLGVLRSLRTLELPVKIVIMTAYPGMIPDNPELRGLVDEVRLKGMSLIEWKGLFVSLLGTSAAPAKPVRVANRRDRQATWLLALMVISLGISTLSVLLVGPQGAFASIGLGLVIFLVVSGAMLVVWKYLTGGDFVEIGRMVIAAIFRKET